MKYTHDAMRRLILSVAPLFLVLLVTQSALAQCVTNDLKAQWRSGAYEQVLRPLLDCYKRRPLGVTPLEIQYMLAKTLDNLPRQKKNGCRAYSSLKANHGRSIKVFGSRIYLDRDTSCSLLDYSAQSPPAEGVGVTQQFIRVPFVSLVDDVQKEIGAEDLSGKPSATTAVERYSQITSMLSRRCLDIMYGSLENAALLIQFDCHNQANQSWRFVKRDDGSYNIIVMHSGKCLDVNGSSQVNGIEIFQHDCHDGDNQRWRIVRNPNGYSIVAKHSGKCLDLYGGNQENMAHIVQWDCHYGPTQTWAIASEALDGITVGPPTGTRKAAPATERRVAPPPPQRRPQYLRK